MLTDFRVTLQAQRPLAWPHFAGSRIRGAWGRALRQAACITGQPGCGGCPVRSHCAYGAVFDSAAPAQPLHPSFQNGIPAYLVQVPPLGARQLHPGDEIGFTLRLLAGTPTQHSLVEHTLRETVNQHLFDPGDCALKAIERHRLPLADAMLNAAPDATIDTAPKTTAQADHTTLSAIHIQWLTPLRLQHQGKPLFKPQDLNSTTLANALWRRQLQWHQLIHQTPPASQTPLQAAQQCTLNTQALQWHDISRYSNTQQKHLPLGGLLGSTLLTGPERALAALLPALRLGEQLHIGKETVFGLGQYQVQPIA